MPLFLLAVGMAAAFALVSGKVHNANSFSEIRSLIQEEQLHIALQPSNTPEAAATAPVGTQPQSPAPPAVAEFPNLERTPDSTPAAALEHEDGKCQNVDASGLFCVYTVLHGDTLWGIATALGLAGTSTFTAAELIAMSNGLGDPELVHIRPGDELLVPLASGVLHRVQFSDALSSLAVGYGTSIEEIMSTNGLSDANTVIEGVMLLIPSPATSPFSEVAAGTYMATVEDEAEDPDTTMATVAAEEGEADSSLSSASPPGGSSEPAEAEASEQESDEDLAVAALVVREEDEDTDVGDEEDRVDPQQLVASMLAAEANTANEPKNEHARSEREPDEEPSPALSSSEDEEESGSPSPVSSSSADDEASDSRPRSSEDRRDEEEQQVRVADTPTPRPEEEDDEAAGPTSNAVPVEATATPSPTETPTPSPTATPSQTPDPTPKPQAAENLSVETIKSQFSDGYRSAGGSEGYLAHILNTVIPCESSYNVRAYNPAGPFYGLMQFLEATWIRSGGGDWYDPRQQGANTARLLQSARPETQWPHCWLQ